MKSRITQFGAGTRTTFTRGLKPTAPLSATGTPCPKKSPDSSPMRTPTPPANLQRRGGPMAVTMKTIFLILLMLVLTGLEIVLELELETASPAVRITSPSLPLTLTRLTQTTTTTTTT